MFTTFDRRVLLGFTAGLAVAAVAVVGLRAWRVDAIGETESAFVPISPCRLLDTRASTNVGPKSSPLGPAEEYALQVTGAQGDCSIPASATAVSINLTAVGASQPTFVSVYPDGVPNPGTSVLNVVPGSPPTPNKLDVQISSNGRLILFNRFGTVDLVGDVMGYYQHDGLSELEQRIEALEGRTRTLEDAQPFTVTSSEPDAIGVDYQSSETVASVVLEAPGAGHVTVMTTASTSEPADGEGIRCTISDSPSLDADYDQYWESLGDQVFPSGADGRGQINGVRTFAVDGTEGSVEYQLVCLHIDSSGMALSDRVITAIYTPAG